MLEVDVAPSHATAVVEQLRGLIGQIPKHPSLVTVLDADISHGGRVFVVTPPVTGESLDAALAAYGPAAFGDALPRLQQLADALDKAAAVGLWHGALTPRHIIIGADETHLVELGVAQALARAGQRVPAVRPYAAPEVVDGGPGSPAGDQYSLAAIAHEWLFGRAVAGPAETVIVLPNLPGLNAGVLSSAFTAALSADRDERFPTCTAFVDALGNATRADVEIARPAPAEFMHPPPIELGDPVDEPLLNTVPINTAPTSFAALDAVPPAAGYGGGALAAALVAGIVIGAAAMWMWMPGRERVVADAGTQELIDTPPGAAAAPIAKPSPSAAPEPAPPAPPPPADDVAPAARAATASLLVGTVPAGATVTIDGVPRGVTPLRLRDLALGVHTVVVSRPGYVAAERQVTLTSDRPSRSIDITLSAARAARPAPPERTAPSAAATTGSLVIESRPPGATVNVDGRRVGVTPMTIATIAPGRHTVRLERPGFRPWTTTIDVQAGARARIGASLDEGQEDR